MAAAEQPGVFQQILQIIGDITGTANSMNTTRLNSAQEIQGRLQQLRGAIGGLRTKATGLQTAIRDLQAIRDPNVLDEENRQVLANHEAELNQIKEQLTTFQTQIVDKAQEFDRAASGEETAKQSVLTDIAGLLEEISAIDTVLTEISNDVTNLRRVAGAAAGPGAGPGGPPAGGPRGYRENPPDPDNPGRRSGMLGGTRRRKRGGRKTRRRRGGYTYPRTRTHVRPALKKTKNHKRKRGKKTKKRRRKRKH